MIVDVVQRDVFRMDCAMSILETEPINYDSVRAAPAQTSPEIVMSASFLRD